MKKLPILSEMNKRSCEIFRHLVEAWVETGEPVGSQLLSRRLSNNLSSATIRNVMADLEALGLLFAPHTSAGRLPTDAGMRLFINGFLELGEVAKSDKNLIKDQCLTLGKSLEHILEETTSTLSGLARCAGLVVAPKTEQALKHLEFIPLHPGRVLVVMVTNDGLVENRILEVAPTLPSHILIEASNYMNHHMIGLSLEEIRHKIQFELEQHKSELDSLTTPLIEAGMASWTGEGKGIGLIVRGQSHLLEDVNALEDLEKVRNLFDMLETREQMVGLLNMIEGAEGVQIFIGSENELFQSSGCSLIIAPYYNDSKKIIGALGVIGPKRLNYGRIIPMVDYTARMVGKLIGA